MMTLKASTMISYTNYLLLIYLMKNTVRHVYKLSLQFLPKVKMIIDLMIGIVHGPLITILVFLATLQYAFRRIAVGTTADVKLTPGK